MRKAKSAAFGVVVGLLFGATQLAPPASATVLNFSYLGAVTAAFDDFGGTGTVRLTIAIPGWPSGPELSSIYFNFDPSLNAALIGFANQATSDTAFSSFNRGNDTVWPTAFDDYDLEFVFTGPNPFSSLETWAIDLTMPGITASSFDFTSTGGFFSRAVISNIDPSHPGVFLIAAGVKVEVPEPTTLALFAFGLIGLGTMRRRLNN